jgi:hypothetical protein
MDPMQNSQNDQALWSTIVEREMAFFEARRSFLLSCQNRVAVVHNALNTVSHRGTALRLFEWLPVEERQELFDDLINLVGVGHSDITLVRQAILALPQDWVLSKIERRAEPLLQQGTDEEYRRLLELYIDIDLDLTHRLATRALQNDDPDIREAGEDAISWLHDRHYMHSE